MRYRDFQDERLSLLGFGAMRIPEREDKSLDPDALDEMLEYALANGINYFDTAYVYHAKKSEPFLAKALSKYPRESYNFATKFPGHQIGDDFDPAPIFEKQLEQCNFDYFDFYLLHNVYEDSIKVYEDPKWGIIDYFVKQKEEGRIRHLGFSTHGGVEVMREFLERHGDVMEFCQIQLNFIDWELQDAKGKVELLDSYGIPIIVMEPLRGGKLAALGEERDAELKALRPDESIASWGLRWIERIPSVAVILSGMSNMEQLADNVRTFGPVEQPAAGEQGGPLNEQESECLAKIAKSMSDFVPCTACRYCVDHCPVGLDIPELLAMYNDVLFAPMVTIGMRIDALPEDKRPQACVGCGACAQMCPQRIDIPSCMSDFVGKLDALPKWADICAARR
ncbi:MAG: aldo/keto reductase [bacterium]|nr:aldo/keto reductase [bacterium]